ncbi:stalk domain-containing protein, partial [Bacillus cereus]|nr:stalk domain-containing protein [Bacillus cereus]
MRQIALHKHEGKLTMGSAAKYTMNTGSTMFVKDGRKTDMGSRPEIVNGTLYVPLLFYAEALDYNFAADGKKGTVRLTKSKMWLQKRRGVSHRHC